MNIMGVILYKFIKTRFKFNSKANISIKFINIKNSNAIQFEMKNILVVYDIKISNSIRFFIFLVLLVLKLVLELKGLLIQCLFQMNEA